MLVEASYQQRIYKPLDRVDTPPPLPKPFPLNSNFQDTWEQWLSNGENIFNSRSTALQLMNITAWWNHPDYKKGHDECLHGDSCWRSDLFHVWGVSYIVLNKCSRRCSKPQCNFPQNLIKKIDVKLESCILKNTWILMEFHSFMYYGSIFWISQFRIQFVRSRFLERDFFAVQTNQKRCQSIPKPAEPWNIIQMLQQ